MTRRIAMWSGPRNISTAMMRSWESRSDTVVWDEPFYAHYLSSTEFTHHPGYQEILKTHETDWREVITLLSDPLPAGKSLCYQKQMAHHMLPHMPLDWTEEITNVFLIRNPKEMLLSLLEFFPEPTLEETGLPQQVQLFRRIQQRSGSFPPVVDARDILEQPQILLSMLCERVGVPYDDRMMRWQPGLRASDGVWAKHWYKNVAKSTTFGPYQPKTGNLPAKHQPLLQQCQSLYDELAACGLLPPSNS